MDPFIVVVVVAIVAAVGWWLYRRTRPAPVEDEWVLPPESGTRPTPPTPQVFDRATLLNRDRSLDPSGWDDSPDPDDAVEDEGGAAEAPPILDRDLLRRRAGGEPGTDADGEPGTDADGEPGTDEDGTGQ